MSLKITFKKKLMILLILNKILPQQMLAVVSICILGNLYAAIAGCLACQIIRYPCTLLFAVHVMQIFLRDIGNFWKKHLLRMDLCV